MMENKSYSSKTLETLNFDNRTVKSLPIDEETDNYTRQVSGACFSWVNPTACKNPQTVCYSSSAMNLLDLSKEECERPEFAEYFSGNKILPGSKPAAHCYCGHQFGSFAGQLGDGAAMYLGEVINEENKRWEIQLKGAGLTPYSRSADGRKVLRSSIREFLCSEAMHNLGIPTTRAGCCITSDTTVVRDIFYDGNPKHEKCSIVLRIAETFLRIGSFEICKSTDPMTGRHGPSSGQNDILKQLLDYTITSFYPEIDTSSSDTKEKYKRFYEELVRRTAYLVSQWQCVGFCHGVLNTDNTSIVGVTIDYGPYGFMDAYDPEFICNASDDGGRYSYEEQPKVLKWNLRKLMEALKNLIPESELEPILNTYDSLFEKFYLDTMRKKFGLLTSLEDDKKIVEKFLEALHRTSGDFTNCFRSLNIVNIQEEGKLEEEKAKLVKALISLCCTSEQLAEMSKPRFNLEELKSWSMNMQFLSLFGSAGQSIMKELSKSENYEKLKKMKPEEKAMADEELWKEWVDIYITRLQKEGTQQTNLRQWNADRKEVMNNTNPIFILRNYIAQKAIEVAEKGDFSEVDKVLKMLEHPFDESYDTSDAVESPTSSSKSSCCEAYSSPPPFWAYSLRVT